MASLLIAEMSESAYSEHTFPKGRNAGRNGRLGAETRRLRSVQLEWTSIVDDTTIVPKQCIVIRSMRDYLFSSTHVGDH